jgi:hypothetical protein
MKKFTKFWQVMMILMLSSSVAFAQVEQTTSADNDASKTELTKEQVNTLIKKGVISKEDAMNGKIPAEVMEKVGIISQDTKEQISEVDPNPVTYQRNVQTTGTSFYGDDVKVPKTNVLKATFPGGPTEDLFCPSTPGTPIFAEDANGYSSAGTADVDAGYRIYQPYIGNFTIDEIHFWYIHAYFDGAAWNACTEEPVDVEIGFWNNGAGGPGTNVASYTQSVTGINTGELFAGVYPIFEYQYALATPLTITDGWVSLMGNPGGDPNCWFMWVNSDAVSGPVNAQQETLAGATFSDMGYPASICIYGTNNLVNNVGVSAVTSPMSGTGLTATEVVTINIFNTGSADHLSGFPVEYTYGGNTFNEPYPGPLLSGGTDTYTFIATIDASAPGVYTLTACTVLPFDEVPADDCIAHAFTHFGPYDCDWSIIGYDSYGDGWNGGSIDIYLDGALHHSWIGPATTGPETFVFGIYDPSSMDVVWNVGSWDGEVTYEVYDNFGVLVFSDGPYPTGTTGIAATCTAATCPAPTTQTVANITPTSADLGWTENGTAIVWEIELGPTGFVPLGVGIPVNTNPYTWGGLTAGTTYDWYVRAVCDPFGGVFSTWTGANTFTTGLIYPDLLYQFDAEALTLDNRNLGVEFFNGSMWITDANTTLGNLIHEIDPYTSTLLNSYLQGTTTAWGMRDMANDGTLLYASDANGFYSIDPATGVVTTVFGPTAPVFAHVSPLRALAYDGVNFWSKSFGGVLINFDIAGNVVSGPFTIASSTYGMAYDPTVPCLWLHATGTGGNEMVQVDMLGALTGVVVHVPVHPCGPASGSVGGAFMDFGNMYAGQDVFGVLDQATPDVVKIFEAYDTGFPGQTSNHVPVCGAAGIPTTGTLTWDFGANTDSYDVFLRLAGATWTQVVDGFSTGGSPNGSYIYSGLTASANYEWRVDGWNIADLGPTTGLVYNFTTACPTFTAPFYEDFLVWPPICWDLTGGTYSWVQYVTAGPPAVECAKANFWGQTSGNTDIMTTPSIDISGLTNPGLWFDWSHLYSSSYPADQMEVFVSDDGGTTWTSVWLKAGTDLDSGDGATSTAPGSFVQSVYIDLSAFGGTVLVQFYATSGYGPDLFVDNVYVDGIPQCPPPSGLAATNITQTSADIDWTEGGTATNWEYDYGVAPYGPPAGAGTLTAVKPVALLGLTPGTDYDWWVRADCGSGVYSIWVGGTFTTLYPPPANDDCVNAQWVSAPYPQVVTGTTNGATVDCPATLAWDAVWYEIDLPYAYNYVDIVSLCLDNEPTLSNTGIILTADCSCDAGSFIYSTGTWSVAGNCINNLAFEVAGPTTVYYPVMTEPKDDFTFTVMVSELYGINGALTYANGPMTAMELDDVTIDDGTDVIVGSTVTGIGGNYLFGFVPAGAYTLGGSTTKAWGGLSMNDVQLARQYVTGQPPGNALSGLHLEAGDVDLDGFVLMNDVQAMRQQFTSQPPGFAPFWIFDDPSVTVGPSATQDFQAICGGDTDGSFVPPLAPPGAVCGNAIPLGYSGVTVSVTNQTNCGLGNFYDNTCLGYYDGGEDIIYELTVTGDWTVNITMDPKGTTWTGFCIDDVCPPGSSCIASSTNSGGTAHSIEGLALTAGVYYIMVDTWPSPTCIPDFDLTIDEWVPAYCIAGVGPTNTYDSNVETVDITGDAASAIAYLGCTNPTGGGGWTGVEDLTATMSVDVTIGLAYSIDVTFGTCGSSYSGAGEVWIDWNQNYTFDAGESIGTWSGSPPSLQTFNFTVPAGATTGATRMRVMQHESGSIPLDPCGGFTWGSVVDFTVNVN